MRCVFVDISENWLHVCELASPSCLGVSEPQFRKPPLYPAELRDRPDFAPQFL